MDILISSNNKDKIKEIKEIFDNENVNLLALSQFPDISEVVEDRNTLFENALKKARVLFEYTNIPTIADDTGLEVDALNGAPGIYSARYAGENVSYDDNVNKLLNEMQGITDEKRTARFKTVAVFYSGSLCFHETGIIEGTILNTRKGKGGFGYDPVFFIPEIGKSFSDMTIEEKNKISHRGQAFTKLYQSFIHKTKSQNDEVSPS